MKNSVSIWYGVIFSLFLTSCFETKESNNVKSVTADKPIVVPQFEPTSVSPTSEKNINLTEQDQSKLACIQSICGTEYILTPEYVKHPAILENSLKIVEQKLSRSIELKMGQTIKNGLITGNVLKEITPSRLSGIQFTPEQIGFLNALNYLKKIGSYYSALERDSKNKIIFSQEKLKKNNPELKDLEIQAISSLAAIFQASDFQKVDPLLYKYALNRLREFSKKKDGTLSEASTETDILKYAAESIEEMRLNVFSRIYIKELLVNEIQMVVDKAIAKKELSMKEKIDLINKYGSYLFMNIMITDPDIKNTFNQLPFSSSELLAQINQNYKSSFQTVFEDKAKFKSAYAADLIACKKDLAQSFSETPSAQEIKKAETMTQTLAGKANAVINRKSMQSNPMEIEFIMPKNQDEVLKDWEVKFDYELKQSEMIQKTIKDLPQKVSTGNF